MIKESGLIMEVWRLISMELEEIEFFDEKYLKIIFSRTSRCCGDNNVRLVNKLTIRGPNGKLFFIE